VDPDTALGELSSVGCDVVPFTKNLLFADTTLAGNSELNARYQGFQGRRSFMALESRGEGKAVARSEHLFNASSTYRDLIGRLGNDPTGNDGPGHGIGDTVGIPLAQGLRVMGDAMAHVLETWLLSARGGRGGHGLARLAKDLEAGVRPGSGGSRGSAGEARSVLHLLAASGAAPSLDVLAAYLEREAPLLQVYTTISTKKGNTLEATAEKFHATARRTLAAKDARGQTPVGAATLRWVALSAQAPVLAALTRVATAAGLRCHAGR
jgi:hypothetical protein